MRRNHLPVVWLAGATLLLVMVACAGPTPTRAVPFDSGQPHAQVATPPGLLAPQGPAESNRLVTAEPASGGKQPSSTLPAFTSPAAIPSSATSRVTHLPPTPTATRPITAPQALSPTAPASATSAPAVPPPAAPAPLAAWKLVPPLVVDGTAGRLYITASAAGRSEIVALSAADGRLLATYGTTGTLAVDPVRGWLYVDRDDIGLTVLDTRTGDSLATIPLPRPRERRLQYPAPQADPGTGRVLAFRDNRVYLLDPEQGTILETIPFDVPRSPDCRSPLADPLPIEWAAYDSARRLLYLDFTTYVCTPWIGQTIVAYDLEARVETARQGYSNPVATPHDGYLYGSSWYRMGMGYRWGWRGGQPWLESEGWTTSAPLYADPSRGWLYEASGDGGLRVLDAGTMALVMTIPSPVDGHLVGYDPQTEHLYFLSDGLLQIVSARTLEPPSPEPLQPADPPAKPVRFLYVPLSWPDDRTLVGLWGYDSVSGECYLFGAQGGLLYLSGDGGRSWSYPEAGLRGGCQRISTLAISPGYAHDQTLFAGVVGKGIFRSTDGGRLWLPSGQGLQSMTLPQILLSPAFERDQTAFARSQSQAGGRGQLHRSRDGGITWQRLNVELQQVALSPEFDRDGVLLGVSGSQVRRSSDSGDHWQSVGQVPVGVASGLLSIAPLFERWGVAFAFDAVQGALHRSADGGQTWYPVLATGTNGLLLSAQLVYGPENETGRLLFLLVTARIDPADPVSEQGSLYRSLDGGATWAVVDLEASLPALAGRPGVPTALAISPIFAQDRLLFLGTAGGQVWTLDGLALVGEE